MPLFKDIMKEELWKFTLKRFQKKFVGWKSALLNDENKSQLVISTLKVI